MFQGDGYFPESGCCSVLLCPFCIGALGYFSSADWGIVAFVGRSFLPLGPLCLSSPSISSIKFKFKNKSHINYNVHSTRQITHPLNLFHLLSHRAVEILRYVESRNQLLISVELLPYTY
jgi:hypothetical protein